MAGRPHLNRPVVRRGTGCPSYLERPQLCTSRGPAERAPKEPVSVCVGGVTSSFLSPFKGWPHHPPVLKPEPWALSLTPLFPTHHLPGLPACLKRPLVIQGFSNSMSLPCSSPFHDLPGHSDEVQAAEHGFRDLEQWVPASPLAPAPSPLACPV